MVNITSLSSYKDKDGNILLYNGNATTGKVLITFRGKNNFLYISNKFIYDDIFIYFMGNNSEMIINDAGFAQFSSTRLSMSCALFTNSYIHIYDNITSSGLIHLWAGDNTGIHIGSNCMLSSDIEITTTDQHAIYDIQSKTRINPNQSIDIGCNVWVGKNCKILKGVVIGNGSMIGTGSIVTKNIPENCIAAGVPARVVRRGIVWDRRNIEKPDAYVRFPFRGESASHLQKGGCSTFWKVLAYCQAVFSIKPK